ncbi:unnamed protein product [Brassica oleracea var. botrytis]
MGYDDMGRINMSDDWWQERIKVTFVLMIMLMVDILLMNQQVIELWKVYVTTLQMRWVEEVVCHTRKSFVILYLSFIFTLDFVFMKL